MAKTMYFSDGTYEIMFQESRDEFARILYDRLGADAKRMFLSLTQSMQDAIDGYESCDPEAALDEAMSENRRLEQELQDARQELQDQEDRINGLEQNQEDVLESARGYGRRLLTAIEDMHGIPDSVRDIAEELALLGA